VRLHASSSDTFTLPVDDMERVTDDALVASGRRLWSSAGSRSHGAMRLEWKPRPKLRQQDGSASDSHAQQFQAPKFTLTVLIV
jgi:hypothetical protein